MSTLRTIARMSTLVVATGLGALAAAPAFAHVSISPRDAQPGAFTVATVSVPHGCDGSATTKVAIKIPEPILSVTPTRNPFWTVKKVLAEVNPPATDAHGNEVTERVDQVVYTAKDPLPDGIRDAFELSFQVPDLPGETLLFPTVQTCEKGQTAWIEEAVEGGEEPEHPAPVINVSAPPTEAETAAPVVETSDDSALAWAGLGAGALGLLVGGTALVRGRRGATSA